MVFKYGAKSGLFAVFVALLIGCEGELAHVEPDADIEISIAGPLAPGDYKLTWTCLDGCGGLLFPPANYNRLAIDADYDLTFYTADTTNLLSVPGAAAGDCINASALTYTLGATGPITFCGGTAQVSYVEVPQREYPACLWEVSAGP